MKNYDDQRLALTKIYHNAQIYDWINLIPDRFFEALDALCFNEFVYPDKRIHFYHKFIYTHIFDPLKDSLSEELSKLGINDLELRNILLKRWFTNEGRDTLLLQIGQVMGVVQSSANLRKFKEQYARLGEPITLIVESLKER